MSRPGTTRRRVGLIAGAVAIVVAASATIISMAGAQAAAIPDHNVLYASSVSGMNQLFLRHTGGQIEQLTSDTAHEVENGSLAPDASLAVFSKTTTTSGDENLYVVDIATKAVRELTNLPGQELYPAISPDQTKVAFYYNPNTGPVPVGTYIINLDGTGLRRLTPLDVSDSGVPVFGPSWSHDNARLAVSVVAPAGYALEIIDVASGGYSKLNNILGPDTSFGPAVWTPDDAYLVHYLVPGHQLHVTEVATGSIAPLSGNLALIYGELSISNDWTLYYEATPVNLGGARHIHQVSLANLASDQLLINAPTGDFAPSVQQSGPIGPKPAGFPGGIIGSPAPSISPSASPSASPTIDCPSVQVYGVRGSRGGDSDTAISDAEMDSIFDIIREKVPGSRSAPIAYTAIKVDFANLLGSYGPDYADSTADGQKKLRKALVDFWTGCPSTYVIIAGYSQGAHVAGDVTEGLTLQQRKHVAALLLFGDPRFNPKEKKANVPSAGYSSKLSGSFQVIDKHMRNLPTDLVDKTRSYCIADDPVCNLSAGNLAGCLNLSACPHMKYVSGTWTQLAAFWAITHWRGLPPL